MVEERSSESAERRGAALSGGWVVAVWAANAAIAYVGFGEYMALVVEGNDRSLLSPMPLLVSCAATGIALVVTLLWARGRASTTGAGEGRRRFLVGGAAIVGGLAATLAGTLGRNRGWMLVTGPALQPSVPTGARSPKPEWAGARVREYRRLGRTGFQVSDISLGSTRIRGEQGERVARAAMDRGVNYFDTAPDYGEEGSELTLGRVLQGRRDQMFLATKFCTPQGDLPAGTPVSKYMEVVEASLGRLQTDYVDLIHIHACDRVERLLDENAHEAFDRLKEQGKVRFMGFSSHTPNLEAVAEAAIVSDRFDVMMLAYHHGAWPRLGELIDRAHERDVGVVAMKTLKGAYHRGLLDTRDEADSYTQAAFKWVLGNPSVSCLVISFREMANVDEYLHASGGRLTSAEQAVLGEYDRRIAGLHCRPHCGLCLGACSEGLPIDDVLRYRMYFESYGDEKEAMRLYGRLEDRADVCVGCTAPCAGTCPSGIDIQERMDGAHRLLSVG